MKLTFEWNLTKYIYVIFTLFDIDMEYVYIVIVWSMTFDISVEYILVNDDEIRTKFYSTACPTTSSTYYNDNILH